MGRPNQDDGDRGFFLWRWFFSISTFTIKKYWITLLNKNIKIWDTIFQTSKTDGKSDINILWKEFPKALYQEMGCTPRWARCFTQIFYQTPLFGRMMLPHLDFFNNISRTSIFHISLTFPLCLLGFLSIYSVFIHKVETGFHTAVKCCPRWANSCTPN